MGVRGMHGREYKGYIRRRWWRTWWEGEREEEKRVQSRAPRDVHGGGFKARLRQSCVPLPRSDGHSHPFFPTLFPPASPFSSISPRPRTPSRPQLGAATVTPHFHRQTHHWLATFTPKYPSLHGLCPVLNSNSTSRFNLTIHPLHPLPMLSFQGRLWPLLSPQTARVLPWGLDNLVCLYDVTTRRQDMCALSPLNDPAVAHYP